MPTRPVALLLRLALLAPAFLLTFILGAKLFPAPPPPGVVPEAGPFSEPISTLVFACTTVLVVGYVIFRSRLEGWRLALTLAASYYVCTTFLAQVETGVFLLGRTVSEEALVDLFLMGVPPALLFIPLAVKLLAPLRPPVEAAPPSPMPPAQWAWKLSVLAVGYLVLYLLAGYYIAWQNPELRALYGGTDPGGFLAMMRTNAAETPWVFPLQLVRGLLWVAFALPVVRAGRPGTWANAVAAALLISVPMNVAHLFTNPFLPVMSVRMSHLVETTTSNLVFGLLVAWLMHGRHESWRDLFGLARSVGPAASLPAQAASRTA